MNLKKLVEDTDTRGARVFDLVIETLIVLSLVSFCVETLPNLGEGARFWLYVFEMLTVAVFTVEYALRILLVDSRLRLVLSFYGLVDLMAILPFYVSTGVDLRSVRVFRLFRTFRVFKLFRYTRAIARFRDAFLEIKDELAWYMMATGFIVFLSAVGIYYFEGEEQPEAFGSVFHCLWWAIVTLTTVGYGDVC